MAPTPLRFPSARRAGDADQLRHLPRVERQFDNALAFDTVPTPTVRVSTSGAVAVTATCSDTAPTTHHRIHDRVGATCRHTRLREGVEAGQHGFDAPRPSGRFGKK